MMRNYVGLKTNKDVLVIVKNDGLYDLNENKKLRQTELTYYNLTNDKAILCYDYLVKHKMDYIIESMNDYYVVIKNRGLNQQRLGSHSWNANWAYRFKNMPSKIMFEFENQITRFYGHSMFPWDQFFKILLEIGPDKFIKQKDLFGLKRKRYKADGEAKTKYTQYEKDLALQALRGSMRFCNLMYQNNKEANNEMDMNYTYVNFHQAEKIVKMAEQSKTQTLNLLIKHSVGKKNFTEVINTFEGSIN